MERDEVNRVVGDKVFALGKRQATQRSKVLVDMLDYWQNLRPEGALPNRSDIDPRRIEGALPYAFVLERLAPGVARLRVAGGHLNDLLGMEVRGMPLSALFQQQDRNKLMALMDRVFTCPSALELELSVRAPGSGQVLKAEMMVLPLLDDQGMVTRALGCVVGRGAFPSPPYRFSIDTTRETEISIDRTRVSFAPARLPKPKLARGETLSGRPARDLAGFAAPRPEFRAKPAAQDKETAPGRSLAKAPFLRVVK